LKKEEGALASEEEGRGRNLKAYGRTHMMRRQISSEEEENDDRRNIGSGGRG
jgi:hypothetical protein